MLKKISIHIILILITFSAFSQSIGDSVIKERNQAYSDYRDFRENMGERTWLNLVHLTLRAEDILELDNNIIHNYLNKELERNKTLSNQLNKLKMEIAVLKNEIEANNKLLKERDYYFKILMYLSIAFLLLLILVTFLYIDRQIKYRSTKIELERQWAQPEDKASKDFYEGEIHRMKESQTKLENENKYLKQQLAEETKNKDVIANESLQKEIEKLKQQNESLAASNNEMKNGLEKELRARKEIEEEIRELIKQVKTTG